MQGFSREVYLARGFSLVKDKDASGNLLDNKIDEIIEFLSTPTLPLSRLFYAAIPFHSCHFVLLMLLFEPTP